MMQMLGGFGGPFKTPSVPWRFAVHVSFGVVLEWGRGRGPRRNGGLMMHGLGGSSSSGHAATKEHQFGGIGWAGVGFVFTCWLAGRPGWHLPL